MSFEGRHAYLYLLAIAVVLGLIGVIVTNQEGSGTPAAAYSFGTLVSETAHAAQESKKGIRVAMVELSWRRYEPQPGHWDSQYIRSVHDEVEGQERAGRRVTLGLGLQSPPDWLYDVPNSRLIDQRGQQSAEINLIFNWSLRQRAEEYFRQLGRDVDLGAIWALRLTSGASPEVLYPQGGSYWAFDQNAQNGLDRPLSMAANPEPGWRPGDRTLSQPEVARWAGWYVDALVDVVEWQVRDFDALGFTGYYQVLTPGSGVRPDGYRDAINRFLPDGTLGLGAVWGKFYADLEHDQRIVAYISSMADYSGGDDSCSDADRSTDLDDPTADHWSAARWISRIADTYGLAKNGENPGWNNPSALNGHYRDGTDAGMMAVAMRQMTSCHLQGMYWAHDGQLWDGTIAFARFAGDVSRINKRGSPLPAMPALVGDK